MHFEQMFLFFLYNSSRHPIEVRNFSIRYSTYSTNKNTGEKSKMHTMEFVHFKDNPEPIGARVIEGWAISDSQLSVE